MRRLTRGGMVEPVSHAQIPSRKRRQEKKKFPAQLATSRIGNNTRLIHTMLKVLIIHTSDIDVMLFRGPSSNESISFATWESDLTLRQEYILLYPRTASVLLIETRAHKFLLVCAIKTSIDSSVLLFCISVAMYQYPHND